MVSTEIGGVRSCSFYNAQHIHFEPVGPTEGRDDTIYEEMLSLVKNYKDYSVLGHMDLLKRYDEAGIYPFEKLEP